MLLTLFTAETTFALRLVSLSGSYVHTNKIGVVSGRNKLFP